MIKMILARDKNNLIGNNDKLPWHISKDLQFFKKMTLNNYLLMGETTFDGLPVKLNDRKIIVMSFNDVDKGDETIHDFNDVLKRFKNSNKDIFIAGGKSIYEQFYKYADEIYITEINSSYEGNVFINIDLSNYKKEAIQKEDEFTIYKYTKGEQND